MRCANTCTTQEKGILALLPSGGRLECDVPTLALQGIYRESAGHYHLMDKESNGGMGFRRELPAHLRGFRQDQNGRKIHGTVPGSAASNSIFLKNLTTKTSLKLKINLIRPY
jgi:hypothetical protein